MKKLHTWAFYHKDAKFLGLAYIRIDTLSILQVREQLKKEGLKVEDLEIYLVRDYC